MGRLDNQPTTRSNGILEHQSRSVAKNIKVSDEYRYRLG